MVDIFSKEKRSEIMSHIKAKDTSIEVSVRSYLHKKGYRFRVNDRRYPGKPDIVMPKYKTIIFIHGCFWHRHGCKNSSTPKSNKEYWESKLTKNVERDNSNALQLKKMGWHVIIIWECELNSDFVKRMKAVENEIVNISKRDD